MTHVIQHVQPEVPPQCAGCAIAEAAPPTSGHPSARPQSPLERDELRRKNRRLAEVSAQSAELPADLEERKEQLECVLAQLQDEQRARRLAEERLAQKQKLEVIGALAGGVAHEVNNPLTFILMNAGMLRDALSDDRHRKLMDAIVEGGERIARVIRGLQSFAESKGRGFRFASPRNMVQNALSLVRKNAQDARADLVVDLPDDLPDVTCSPQQVQQVLLNLLTNACEAMAREDPADTTERTITVGAHVIDDSEQPFLRLCVADTAGSLPEDIRHRVFDPFYSTKSEVYDVGLGLSVCHRIAEDHGGSLTAETGPDTWTRFHFDIPLAPTCAVTSS